MTYYYCSVCQHQSTKVGFDEDRGKRKCIDCGNNHVYSLVELLDIANAYRTMLQDPEAFIEGLE